MDLKEITMEQVKERNRRYHNGEYMGSEVRPYKEDVMEKFINEIRPSYRYTENYNDGEQWDRMEIVESRSKYGTNFIYLDHKNKLWRTRQTACEFYGM